MVGLTHDFGKHVTTGIEGRIGGLNGSDEAFENGLDGDAVSVDQHQCSHGR